MEMATGTVAARFGLAPHVLRHWEDMGLLTPSRRANGRRVYGPEHLAAVALIRIGKDSGLSLDQIRTLMTTGDRHPLLAARRAELAAEIARLQASVDLLDHALACPAPDFHTCPDLAAKVAAHIT